MKEALHYLTIIKKAFYPEFAFYAECVVVHIFETTLNLDIGNVKAARVSLNKTFRIAEAYINNYSSITKKLKLKGSKYKFFHLKNKITPVSRMHPDALKGFLTYTSARVTAAEAKKPH